MWYLETGSGLGESGFQDYKRATSEREYVLKGFINKVIKREKEYHEKSGQGLINKWQWLEMKRRIMTKYVYWLYEENIPLKIKRQRRGKGG